MKKIVHLSDLHFGTEKKEIVPILLDDIKKIHPDLIIISGDFTQRALSTQFYEANAFISSLNQKNILSIPGNHDISLYNLFRRFFKTYDRYKKYIFPELNPYYCDEEIAVLGINSVNPFKPMSGKLIREQLDYISNFFHKQPSNRVKILAMHHNLLRSERHKIIKNSNLIINTLAECKVNLVLGGHIHYGCLEEIKSDKFHHVMYIITAGTAISDRLWKDEKNSFNVLEIEKNQFKMLIKVFDNKQFIIAEEKIYPISL